VTSACAINRQIIELLGTHDSLERTSIYEKISEGRQLIYYRINNLIEAGILTVKDERNTELILTPGKKKKILKLLNNLRDEI